MDMFKQGSSSLNTSNGTNSGTQQGKQDYGDKGKHMMIHITTHHICIRD